VVISPDYSEASKFSDLWLSVKQGTDSALAMAMGHVILKEFHVDKKSDYFDDYTRKYTDFPFLVRLVEQDGKLVPERFLRASDFLDGMGEENNTEWKTVAVDEKTGDLVLPQGSVGFRWGEDGRWNLQEKEAGNKDTKLQKSLIDKSDAVPDEAFPYIGNKEPRLFCWN